jgi:hypothetical protein
VRNVEEVDRERIRVPAMRVVTLSTVLLRNWLSREWDLSTGSSP